MSRKRTVPFHVFYYDEKTGRTCRKCVRVTQEWLDKNLHDSQVEVSAAGEKSDWHTCGGRVHIQAIQRGELKIGFGDKERPKTFSLRAGMFAGFMDQEGLGHYGEIGSEGCITVHSISREDFPVAA